MMPPFAVRATGATTRKALTKLDLDGRAMRRMEREFQAAVERALGALRLDLVRGLNDGNVGQLTARLDDEAVTRPFQDAVVGQLRRVALAGSEFGQQQVEQFVFGTRKALSPALSQGARGRKAAIEVGVWELANNAAAQWAMSYGYDLVRGLLATTRDRLQAEVAEYIRNSETIGQLTARIRQASGFADERARMIAVTEVTRAYAEGNRAAWRASGVIEAREWRTNADELVCPVCGPLAGRVVGLDEPFADGVDGPPAHPRCRCWCVPAIENVVVPTDPAAVMPPLTPEQQQAVLDWFIGNGPYDDGEPFGLFPATEVARQKHALAQQLAKSADISYHDANRFIHQWAASSNDHDLRSLSIQQAAGREFNVALSPWQQLRLDALMDKRQNYHAGDMPFDLRSIFESASQHQEAVVDRTVRSIYRRTQKELKAAGIDTVTLYRGIGLTPERVADIAVGGRVQLEANVLESFSLRREIADVFAGGRPGSVVVRVTVPARDVYSTARTGVGCLNEWEVVLINKPDRVYEVMGVVR